MITVIIPVYNCEKYLNTCIESIVNQTYKNLEIILVNDGSTDNTKDICNIWKKKDSRIKVYNIKNNGSAHARNIGILNSSGDYFYFIDSDDYIESDMLENLLFLMEKYNCQIVESGYDLVNDRGDMINSCSYDLYHLQEFTSYEAMQYHIKDEIFKQIIWNKLYKKDVIVKFKENKIIDDEFWTYLVLSKAEHLFYTKKIYYHYRQHDNSIMHVKYSLKNLDVLEARRLRYEFIKNNNYFNQIYKMAKQSYFFTNMYHAQKILRELSGKEKEIALKIVKNHFFHSKLSLFELLDLNKRNKFWVFMTHINFILTCKIRNFLKIGTD